jgi:hypothetical protein
MDLESCGCVAPGVRCNTNKPRNCIHFCGRENYKLCSKTEVFLQRTSYPDVQCAVPKSALKPTPARVISAMTSLLFVSLVAALPVVLGQLPAGPSLTVNATVLLTSNSLPTAQAAIIDGKDNTVRTDSCRSGSPSHLFSAWRTLGPVEVLYASPSLHQRQGLQ